MTKKTFETIERALGFKLHDWQKDYISLSSDWMPDERQTGRTTAFILRHLLNYGEKLGDYRMLDPKNKYYSQTYEYWRLFPCDRDEPLTYVYGVYPQYVKSIDAKLKVFGLETCFRE